MLWTRVRFRAHKNKPICRNESRDAKNHPVRIEGRNSHDKKKGVRGSPRGRAPCKVKDDRSYGMRLVNLRCKTWHTVLDAKTIPRREAEPDRKKGPNASIRETGGDRGGTDVTAYGQVKPRTSWQRKRDIVGDSGAKAGAFRKFA